jgi:type IV pilus assembly protein PilC
MKQKKNLKPLSFSEISLFCEQLSMTLRAGISAAEGIRILYDESKNAQEREILGCIIEHLENLESLHDSLAASKVFPKYMLNMIRIGEETGTLDEVTASLSEYYDHEDSVKKYIRESVTSPVIMSSMIIAVIIVLLVKVMPIFNQVYMQLGSELTGFSGFLLELGNAIVTYSIPIILIAALIVFLLIFGFRTEKGKNIRRDLAYKTGISKSYFEDLAAMRFAAGMALVLKTGMSPDSGIDLVSDSVEDPFFAEKLEIVKSKLHEGVSFTDAVFDAGIFSGSYARMLSVGSRSGATDTVMARIAQLYRENVNTRVRNRIARIEPALVITMSVFVGCILLSVMLPLIGILSGI